MMYQSVFVNIKVQILKISIFLTLVCLSLGCVYQVERGENWSKSIDVQKTAVTETMTVRDLEAGWLLFSYFEKPSAQPIMVHKINPNHWITIFEKPTMTPSPKVRIEKISENEFRVLLIQGDE
jgi:hypothetical protein